MTESTPFASSKEDVRSQRTEVGNRNPDFLGTVDQYTLLRELGSGGFGVVYLAEDAFTNVKYALKTILPEMKSNAEAIKNLKEKFALVQKLSHPNIAGVHYIHRVKEVEYGFDEVRDKLHLSCGDFVMVMRYAPGDTLSNWRRRFPKGKVPVGKAIGICRQIADALDYAHGENIIHRDIKPGNIIVNEKNGVPEVQVLDFGLAAEIHSSVSDANRSNVDTSGTRPYMAPEQWSGDTQDGRTDQYALAIVFYELVSGDVPFGYAFRQGDVGVMQHKVLHEPVLTINDLSDVQNRALRKALAKLAADRFPTCKAFIDAIEGKAEFHDVPKEAIPKPVESEEPPPTRPNPPTLPELLKLLIQFLKELLRFLAELLREVWAKMQQFIKKAVAWLRGAKGEVASSPSGPEVAAPQNERAETSEWVTVLSRMPKPKTTLLDLGGGLSFEMVELPAGTFRMGSPNGRNGEPGRQPGESLHEVRLTVPFQLAAAPVTRAKWRAVMGADPDLRAGGGDEEPVTGVSWDDCQAFFERLNTSHPIRGYRWSLPTEAQWEFACRAGKAGPYAGTGILDDMGWYAGNAGNAAHPVRQKKPNAWGFYDMHGNVWEWCADGYIPSLGHDSRSDPFISPSSMERVVRGGSWNNNAAFCRCACRRGMVRTARFDSVGFRVALVPR